MSAITDAEFLRLLKKDVDYFRRAVENFESLVPDACSTLQDQWRLQAQARKNFTLDLEILIEKAERCVETTLQSTHHSGEQKTISY
jgi:hypothetical protein